MDFKYQGLGTYKRDKIGRYSSFKSLVSKVWRFIKWSVVASAVVFGAGAFGAAFYSTSTVTATTTTVNAPAPVLDRIADCESGNGTKGSAKHYLNGQVLLRANTNATIDIGKYQVNLTYWGKKATELGFDLTREADNKAMAEWIYANKGTGDWSASQKCWK